MDAVVVETGHAGTGAATELPVEPRGAARARCRGATARQAGGGAGWNKFKYNFQ